MIVNIEKINERKKEGGGNVRLRYVVYQGDSEYALKRVPSNSVHLVVSSPPYFRHA